MEFLGIDPGYMVEASEEFDGERAEEVRMGERERGYNAWEADLRGVGDVLRRKRGARDCWPQGKKKERLLFENEGVRAESGVRTEIVRYDDGSAEEVISNESQQPWEDEMGD